MERVAIFVDAENFHYGLKSIRKWYSDFYFDFEKFWKYVAKKRKLIKVWYVTAPLKGNQSLNHDQQIMLSRMRNIKNFECKVVLCKRQEIPPKFDGMDSRYKIKQDDVALAVEMVHEATKNNYDVAVLISSDGDMMPAVERIKELGKKVELVGFPNRTSTSLINSCHSYKPMNKKIVNKHFLRLQPTLGDVAEIRLNSK